MPNSGLYQIIQRASKKPTIMEALGSAFEDINNTDPGIGPMVIVTPTSKIIGKLNDDLIYKLFTQKLGMAQRGLPEDAMLKVQQAMGGGVLNPVVEHTGDLTHRMADLNTFKWNAGYEYVADKVEKVLRILKNRYGFAKEMEENIVNNANFYNKPVEPYRQQIYNALTNYGEEHSKLPIFNRVQNAANQAAINLGRRNWGGATDNLEYLDTILNKGQDTWKVYASQVDPEFLTMYLNQMRWK